ncbi:endothelial lipase-like [Pieris brassicae]|uniref:endothelial lipase-like n=1 Tax=Pieris brassicae TaxID=7116 RepID=UPI001E661B2D|nr:endothelial lipase-like [Pieris brassicae]
MKLILMIFGITSVCNGATLRSPNEYYRDGDRYFYFPGDGDNMLHLVDIMEPIDYNILYQIRKNPMTHRYWLFSRYNPTTPQVISHGTKQSILNSNFNKDKDIVFLVHGWFGSGVNKMNKMLTDAFLRKKDINIIVVDWSALATRNYMTAKRGVATIGQQLGEFINWLHEEFNVSYNNIHLVGFSLGAHLVGNAGKATQGRVKRITGLDPAGPLWKHDKNRLNKTDSQYVEIIHTNTALYGFSELCGHADFFPNGGDIMPGCWFNVCSHSKGYEYMAATILYNHLVARECFTLKNVEDDKCFGDMYPMGNGVLTKSRSGIFRVNTGNYFPF